MRTVVFGRLKFSTRLMSLIVRSSNSLWCVDLIWKEKRYCVVRHWTGSFHCLTWHVYRVGIDAARGQYQIVSLAPISRDRYIFIRDQGVVNVHFVSVEAFKHDTQRQPTARTLLGGRKCMQRP